MYGTVGRRWYYDGGYAWYGWYDGWHGREGHKTLYVGNCWNRYDSNKLSLACLACYLLLHFPLPLSGHLYVSKGVWAVDSPSIPETISGWTKLIKIDLPQLAFLRVFAQRQIDERIPRGNWTAWRIQNILWFHTLLVRPHCHGLKWEILPIVKRQSRKGHWCHQIQTWYQTQQNHTQTRQAPGRIWLRKLASAHSQKF